MRWCNRKIIGSRLWLLVFLLAGMIPLFPATSPADQDAEHPEALNPVRISVDALHPGAMISPLIFGTNISHPGRVNGIPDRISSEAEYKKAMRKWFGYLPLVSELGPTILRFPGGLNANGYIWTRAVGPVMHRRPMSKRSNSPHPLIGTDEFLLFCEELGAEAMITVNVNRASGDSVLKLAAFTESVYRKNAGIAADWVEYCNAQNNGSNPRGGVDWAAVRARNGHAAPYNVTYWEIGNELQDTPLKWYAKAISIFSREMKSVDPSIRIGVVDPLAGWPEDRVQSWFQEIGRDEANLFDFWIHHTYSPGASGKIRGFILYGPGASLTVPFQVPGSDTYEIRIKAATNQGTARVRVSIPGTGQAAEVRVGRREKTVSLKAPLEGGPHTLNLELVQGKHVLFYHMGEWSSPGYGEGFIDCKRSPPLYRLMVSGALVAAERWWPEDDLGGKPLYVTEYNSVCESFRGTPHLGFAHSLRDALNVGMYLQSFLSRNVPVATQWLLYGDMQGFGLIEGVARDPNHGGELGREGPHPRPSFYMLKLYRDHLFGNNLPLHVESPSYHIGPPRPYVAMGTVNHVSMEIPYIQAAAAGDPEGRRISLLVQNLHERDTLQADIEVKGFAPGDLCHRYQLSGSEQWLTNEPETCPNGDCVRIRKTSFSVPGPRFTCSFPPHSATALILYRKVQTGEYPLPPENLTARMEGSRIRIQWEHPTGMRPHGYRVYRSRFSFGPFRNCIRTLASDRTNTTDTPADKDVSYTYAVKSLSALGRESAFSSRVTLEYRGTEP